MFVVSSTQSHCLQRPLSRYFQRSSAAFLSSSGKKSTTSADTRLAGRLRFYKQVGVQEVPAPWEDTANSSKSETSTTVKNPISAGVDGTDSASGVHHAASASSSQFQHMLLPRAPGASTTKPDDQIQWFGITLDGRAVSTPMGRKLAVPSEMLAYMIATEWDNQEKHLKPTDMPLMTLACTALDQVAHHPDVYREQSMRFLSTDTTCFWADPIEDRVLHRRQEQAWKELHEFAADKFDHPPSFAIGASEAILMSRKRGDAKPSAGLPHPPELLTRATDWTHSLDAWHLVAFSSICSQAKSYLVAWAMLQSESPMADMDKAIEASRVEEEFQISSWGLVEGGHDYDRLNCSIQLYSAKLFAKTIAMDNELK